FFFSIPPSTTAIYTLSLHDALPIFQNNNTVQSESRGQYTFQNIEDLILAKPQLFGGVPIGEEGYKGIRQTMLGFYMQDDFKMSRSEEHTSELQSRVDIVCRLLLEKT